MRKLVVSSLVLLFPLAASAQTISTSKHNLTLGTNTVYTTDAGAQLCKFCHVPHNARTDQNAIWNRPDPASTTFTWGAASPTVGGTTLAANIGIPSLKCFSCHDGTTQIGTLVNGSYTITGADQLGGVLSNSFYVINPASMAGNHPVSVRYPAADNAGLTYNGTTSGPNTSTYVNVASVANVRLYTDPVDPTAYGIECGSCHEPHDNTNTFFLRDTPAGSTICLDCHVK